MTRQRDRLLTLTIPLVLSACTSEPVGETDGGIPDAGTTPPPVSLPGGCWGDDGSPAGALLGSMPDCGGNTADLPGCLFDAATYPDEQTGCTGVFDLDDIRDPRSSNLNLRILGLRPYPDRALDGYIVDLRYENGLWFGHPVTIDAQLILPGASLATPGDLLSGRGFYRASALSEFRKASTEALVFHYGVPVISPNTPMDQVGIDTLDYDTVVSLDPGLFRAVRDSPMIPDEARDVCFSGEPGDGCISSADVTPHELRLCATVIATYTGNLHWSLRPLIASNQLRSMTAGARALQEILGYDPEAPAPAWSAFSGDASQVLAARMALQSLGASVDTPFFSRVGISACSKNGSASLVAAATDDRFEAVQPSCIVDFSPDTVQNVLDTWPDGELDVDYFTGDPAAQLEALQGPDGGELEAVANLERLASTFEARGTHVLVANMGNDQLFPVNAMGFYFPRVVADHPALDLGLNVRPNVRHGAQDPRGLSLLVDAWLRGRRMPQASMCVRDLGGGTYDVEVRVDWNDYAFAAPGASVELWASVDTNGYVGNADLHCRLSDLDFRCSRYAAIPPDDATARTATWRDVLAHPQVADLPYLAFFPVISAPISDSVGSVAFSAAPQILGRPDQPPFHPNEPGGYRLCD